MRQLLDKGHEQLMNRNTSTTATCFDWGSICKAPSSFPKCMADWRPCCLARRSVPDLHQAIFALLLITPLALQCVAAYDVCMSTAEAGNTWQPLPIGDATSPLPLSFAVQISMNFTLIAPFKSNNVTYTEQGVAVFGGLSRMSQVGTLWPNASAAYSDNLWTLDMTVRQWRLVANSQKHSPWPLGRAAHAGGLILRSESEQVFVVFGGRSSTEVFNDTWLFHFAHLVDMYLVDRVVSDYHPSARWGAAFTTLNTSQFYVCGGFDVHGVGLMDVWRFTYDPSAAAATPPFWVWTKLAGAPSAMPGRGFHYFTPASPSTLLLTGGWTASNTSSTPLGDTWLFTLGGNTWTPLPVPLPTPTAAGAAITYVDGATFWPIVFWGSSFGADVAMASSDVLPPSSFIYAFSQASQNWSVIPGSSTDIFVPDSLLGFAFSILTPTSVSPISYAIITGGFDSFAIQMSTYTYVTPLNVFSTCGACCCCCRCCRRMLLWPRSYMFLLCMNRR